MNAAPLALGVKIPFIGILASAHLDILPARLNHDFLRRCFFTAAFIASALALATHAQDGPKNAVVLIIRHAEKPQTGPGLSPRGEQRAEAYKDYFKNFTFDSKRLEPNVIFAAKDSNQSHRPRLTVEPFAKTENLPIDMRFGSDHSAELAADLRATEQGKVILICWRHGVIPDLLRDLGEKPKKLLTAGKWPDAVYNWVVLLSFDQNGRLIPASTRRINEHLLPGDSQ